MSLEDKISCKLLSVIMIEFLLSGITYCSSELAGSRDVVENGYSSTRLRPLKDGSHNVKSSPRDRISVLS